MRSRAFRQVDVFSPEAGLGNPLAVVVDADGLTDAELQRFATWTNLSETTFLLPPTTPAADYRVRIFTTERELPFAGHPTLGSAFAWLESGGRPRGDYVVVQECGAGLVRLRREGNRLAFAAPPLTRYEPVEDTLLTTLAAGLGLHRDEILDASWLVNGPEWIGLRLESADRVLAVVPDASVLGDLDVGLVGPHRRHEVSAGEQGRPDLEVRALISRGTPSPTVVEDPVTGSLNAGLGQWLMDTGAAPHSYLAAQGTVIGRCGRVHVEREEDTLWIGGEVQPVVSGTVQW